MRWHETTSFHLTETQEPVSVASVATIAIGRDAPRPERWWIKERSDEYQIRFCLLFTQAISLTLSAIYGAKAMVIPGRVSRSGSGQMTRYRRRQHTLTGCGEPSFLLPCPALSYMASRDVGNLMSE